MTEDTLANEDGAGSTRVSEETLDDEDATGRTGTVEAGPETGEEALERIFTLAVFSLARLF